LAGYVGPTELEIEVRDGVIELTVADVPATVEVRPYGPVITTETQMALPADLARDALRAAIGRGIRGGALYDAVIGATASHHGHQLLSADRRSAPTYALNVDAASSRRRDEAVG
jgi:hypothetical protein